MSKIEKYIENCDYVKEIKDASESLDYIAMSLASEKQIEEIAKTRSILHDLKIKLEKQNQEIYDKHIKSLA